MNLGRETFVYLVYSFSQSAFKIGVSVDPVYRSSELRWSANNPWRKVIETHLCAWWAFPSREIAIAVESDALKRTQEIAFCTSEWRVVSQPWHDTIGGYMVDTHRFLSEVWSGIENRTKQEEQE